MPSENFQQNKNSALSIISLQGIPTPQLVEKVIDPQKAPSEARSSSIIKLVGIQSTFEEQKQIPIASTPSINSVQASAPTEQPAQNASKIVLSCFQPQAQNHLQKQEITVSPPQDVILLQPQPRVEGSSVRLNIQPPPQQSQIKQDPKLVEVTQKSASSVCLIKIGGNKTPLAEPSALVQASLAPEMRKEIPHEVAPSASQITLKFSAPSLNLQGTTKLQDSRSRGQSFDRVPPQAGQPVQPPQQQRVQVTSQPVMVSLPNLEKPPEPTTKIQINLGGVPAFSQPKLTEPQPAIVLAPVPVPAPVQILSSQLIQTKAPADNQSLMSSSSQNQVAMDAQPSFQYGAQIHQPVTQDMTMSDEQQQPEQKPSLSFIKIALQTPLTQPQPTMLAPNPNLVHQQEALNVQPSTLPTPAPQPISSIPVQTPICTQQQASFHPLTNQISQNMIAKEDVEMASTSSIQIPVPQIPPLLQPVLQPAPTTTSAITIKLLQTQKISNKREDHSIVYLPLQQSQAEINRPPPLNVVLPTQALNPVLSPKPMPETPLFPTVSQPTIVTIPTIITSQPAPLLDKQMLQQDCAVSQEWGQVLQQKVVPAPDKLFVPALSQPVMLSSKREKAQPKRFNIMEFYTIAKRSLAFELQPETMSFRGQVRMELALRMVDSPKGKISLLEQSIDVCKAQGFNRVALESQVLAKQVKVVDVWLLSKNSQTGELKKEKQLQFLESSLVEPDDQAKVNPQLYTGLSRHLYQLEDVQRKQIRRQITSGTIQLKMKKKLFQFKNAEKVRKELHIMIDFLCDHITDIGGLKCVTYRRELGDKLAYSNSNTPSQTCNKYFFTSDEPNQSLSWLPQLTCSSRIASQWNLQFLVPKEYTVLASGKQLERSLEDTTALLEYEITETERTIPDRIGFLICPIPVNTSFDIQTKKEQGAAYFISRQKQANFSPKLASDAVDYVCKLMSQRIFPCKEIKLVFLPNLFPAKFPKQAHNFAGGLHLMDQELLYRPNQIDKRHHLYKHLAASLAFTFFGGRVREADWSDSWLLLAIRERIGDRFTKSKCGALLYRYQVMRRIEKLYKLVKQGIEVHPMQRNKLRDPEQCPDLKGLGCPDPSDQMANDIFYKKCGLVMQMIELKIGDLLDTILKEMYQEGLATKERVISAELFRKTYKKVCGIRPREIFSNWITATSCPKLTLNYEFNKRYNSLDLTLKQQSAAVENMRIQKNISSKIDKIFGMSGQDLDMELMGEEDPAETFNVDQKQACKRWFTGDVNIVICQADGGGGEILKQHHKMQLKDFKSVVSAHITLLGRVRRTQNRKKELDFTLPQAALNEQQPRRIGPSGRPISMVGANNQRRFMGSQAEHDAITNQAAQMMLNQDVQKFEMNEFELEDFPSETKNIFRKELDNNPVLWIRVDPDMEYIRKVEVVQKKRNNWLFQLLREQDIVGQIEAVRQLHKYNEDLVYEILKAVSRNENYFYKVRKEVLKTMQKMEISVFNKYLQHEAFLLKCFNQKNYDEATGFYKENNFQNLLQYYLDRSILKHISKRKEEKLCLTLTSQQKLEELLYKQYKLANESNMEDAASEKTPNKDMSVEPGASHVNQQPQSTMIQINFVSNQLTGIDAKSQKKNKMKGRSSSTAKQQMAEIRDFRITTSRVAEMLLKVLEQNDNSENYFDDSFYIRDILASLGRLDNLNYMVKIAREILRQFKLDQISNSSPQFSITSGAIKGYFNLRKQIYRFINCKRPNIDPFDPLAKNWAKAAGDNGHIGGMAKERANLVGQNLVDQRSLETDQIASTERVLDQMKVEIDRLLSDPQTPLQLRLFIFDEEIKNIIFYQSMPLVKALQVIFEAVFNLQAKMEIRFAVFCLREVVMFLESIKFVGRINFTELHVECEATHRFMETLWSLIVLPHGYLSSEMTYWVKRFMSRLYGNVLPKFLTNRSDMTLDPQILQNDDIWRQTEADLAAEEQKKVQLAELRQEQKNQQMIAATMLAQAQASQIVTDQNSMGAQATSSGQQITIGGRSLTLGASSKASKKRTITLKLGEPSEKQIIQIQHRPTSSTGVTIRASSGTQHSAMGTNGHILNITGGGVSQQQPGQAQRQTKISIQGSSMRLGTEAKLSNELREVSSILHQAGNPSTETAVVHIGPQTHTSITLPAVNQSQHLSDTPLQLIVLPRKSSLGRVHADQDDTHMAQDDSDEEDDEDHDSRSLIRITSGNQQQVMSGDDDDDDDEQSEQNLERNHEGSFQNQDASFQPDDDDQNMLEEQEDEEYGQEQRQDGNPENSDDEEEYDPFARETFADPNMQKCWLILGKLYYHYEVTDFLDPVTPESMGDEKMYEEYCSVVSEPMDISTVMAKMRAHAYRDKESFRRDIELIFDNCREFNEAGTEIVHCANSLTIEFNGLWQEYDMN